MFRYRLISEMSHIILVIVYIYEFYFDFKDIYMDGRTNLLRMWSGAKWYNKYGVYIAFFEVLQYPCVSTVLIFCNFYAFHKVVPNYKYPICVKIRSIYTLPSDSGISCVHLILMIWRNCPSHPVDKGVIFLKVFLPLNNVLFAEVNSKPFTSLQLRYVAENTYAHKLHI